MIANRLTPVLAATALLALLATGASARDRSPGHGHGAPGYHGPHHGHGHHFGRNRLNMLSDRSLGGASRVVTASRSRGSERGSIGFVSGSVIFYSDGGYWGSDAGQDNTMTPAPRAKIIDVNQAMTDQSFAATNGCTFEMGVCVIRGK